MGALDPLEVLGRHLAEAQQKLIEPDDHAALKSEILNKIQGLPRSGSRHGRTFSRVAALAAVAALVSLVWSFRALKCVRGLDGTPVAVDAWMSAPSGAPLELRFSDGTRASLRPLARGRVTRLGSRGADLVVEAGQASFDVVHHTAGQWQVSTGPFVVHVTGTRFDLDWQPDKDRFELKLYAGHVRVSGCAMGEGEEVAAGQRVEASCSRHEFRISALSDPPAPAPALAASNAAMAPMAAPLAKPDGDVSGSISSLAPQRAQREAASATDRAARLSGFGIDPSSNAEWRALAGAGRYGEAYAAAQQTGFDAECIHRGAKDVLLLADAARLSGHLPQAKQAYLAVRQRWPGAPVSSLAAFQIGRIQFDQSGDYASAERWLRLYLSEQPNGEFAAPASGRLMEAELRLGRRDAARELAQKYLARFPKGPHAEAATQVLGTSAARPD